MGFAVVEVGAPCCRNQLIAFETFASLCVNPSAHRVGKVVRLRRSPLIRLGDETDGQIMTSDTFVN